MSAYTKMARILLAMSVLVPAMASAEIRIGVVNAAALLEKAPQAEAARGRLEKEFASRDKQLVAAQKEIKGLEEQLARDGAVMNDEARHKMERDIVAKKRDIKRAQDEFREDLNIRRNEVLADLQRDIMDSIKTLAESEKYDLILSDGVVYARDSVDITDQVLKRLKDH